MADKVDKAEQQQQQQQQQGEERRVLLVGLVCLDIIMQVDDFPVEDSDKRCVDCVWQRGGNASTSATVLSMLGTPASYTGTVAQSQEIHFLREDMARHGVDWEGWVEKPGASCPVSIVILNRRNGSRTVLHSNKGLPELSLAEFQQLDLGRFRWVHFEGRPNANLRGMLEHVNSYNQGVQAAHRVTLSMEAEKATRVDLRELFHLADYVFLSKDFARACGYSDMRSTVQGTLDTWKPRRGVVCGWGEEGAAAASQEEGVVTSPAFVPRSVVDTLGAGDTFIGGALHVLAGGRGGTGGGTGGGLLQRAVRLGCQVAGVKVGMQGNAGLAQELRAQGLMQ